MLVYAQRKLNNDVDILPRLDENMAKLMDSLLHMIDGWYIA